MTKMGLNAQSPQVKAEIVRLGTKYQLASLYTSFIAVEHRTGLHYDCWFGPLYEPSPVPVSVPSYGAPKSLKKMSVSGARGGGGGGGGGGRGGSIPVRSSALAPSPCAPPPCAPSQSAAPPSFSYSAAAAPPMASYDMSFGAAPESLERKKRKKKESFSRARDYDMEECEKESSCSLNDDLYCMEESFSSVSSSLASRSASPPAAKSSGSASDILMEQSVNGSFTLSGRLASLIGTSVDLLKDILANLQLSGGEAEKVIATAAVLVYLEKQCGGQRDLWDLSASKAKRYIEKQGLSKTLSEIMQALGPLF